MVTNGLCICTWSHLRHIGRLRNILSFREWLQEDKEREKRGDQEIRMRPLGNREEGSEKPMFSVLSCIRIHYAAPYRILPPLSSKLLSFSLVFFISLSSFSLNFSLPVSSATRYRTLSGPLPSQGPGQHFSWFPWLLFYISGVLSYVCLRFFFKNTWENMKMQPDEIIANIQ